MLAKSVVLVALVVLFAMAFRRHVMWPRLRQLDPTLRILNDPQRLLLVASSYVGPVGGPEEHPAEPTISMRHEALRALLSVQGKSFQVNLPLIENTTGIDHVYLETIDYSGGNVIILATPARLANMKATEGDYWTVERFTFEKNGRLLRREPWSG
jgi:hypothetical protein